MLPPRGRSTWPADPPVLDDHELWAWQAALDHLAARGLRGIVPPHVAGALTGRRRRRHLRVVR